MISGGVFRVPCRACARRATQPFESPKTATAKLADPGPAPVCRLEGVDPANGSWFFRILAYIHEPLSTARERAVLISQLAIIQVITRAVNMHRL